MYDTQGNWRGKRLYRSAREAMWSGVCGGLAEYFEMDPTLMRLIWVGATVVTGGAAILGYIVMWFVVPKDPGAPIPSGPAPTTGTDDPSASAASSWSPPTGSPGEAGAPGAPAEPAMRTWSSVPPRENPEQRQVGVGLFLVLLGAIFLIGQTGIFHWWSWGTMWPLVLVAVGGFLLFRRVR